VADYYPRAKAHVTVRLDEFSDTSKLQAKVPKKTTKNLDGVSVTRTTLSVQPDPAAPPGVTRYLLLPQGASVTNASPQERARSGDGLTYDFVIVPKSASWMQNGIRTADTLKLVLRWIDAPFDPQVLRAVAVEFYLGCIDEDTAALENENGPSGDVLPETWSDQNGLTRTNLRFQGFAETWEPMFEEWHEPLIEVECVDNTSLLIHQECPPRLTLNANKAIDAAVADYLSNFVQMAGLTVEYQPQSDTRPILKQVLSKAAYRPNLGPTPTHGGAVEQKLSVWDYLTDVCRAIGHSIYVDGTRVVVQRVRSLMANSTDLPARPSDPFLGRVVDGETLNYRRLIYGVNIQSMRKKRSFATHVPPNIEVRSYVAERKTVIVGRFPLPADRQYYALPGDTSPDQKWTVVNVSGVADEKTCRAVAQQEYEQLARSEQVVEVKTRALGSFGGGNTDPDLLDIRFGDTLELMVNRTDDEVATITLMEKALTAQQRAAELMVNLGFDPQFADAYGKAYANSGFVTQFRTHQVRIDWQVADEGGGGGVQLTIQAVNYTQVRADKALPQGEEPSTTSTTSGGS
jgi:hypothetical protein